MAVNTIKTRIQLKNDTEENWNKAVNFIPLKGEIIIYSADDSHPFSRLKVGDGITHVIQLPFINADSLNGNNIYTDTTENFRKKMEWIPKKGDIIIFLDRSTIIKDNKEVQIPGVKIGDGLAYNLDLPFIDENVWENLTEHINNNIRHITAAERQFWNNKINCDESQAATNGILILNRN